MTRYKFSYVDLPDSLDPEELKLNGGFELADVERARLELKQTQKLNSRLRHGDELPVNENSRDQEIKPAIKQNSTAKTLKEARIDLRRTQMKLARKRP